MSRENAFKRAEAFFDTGDFFNLLKDRVAYRSESQNEASTPQALAYLTQSLTPYLEGLGFACRLLDNPTYPDHLIETYHQASFEVRRYTSVGEDGIAIDAVIVLSEDESVEKRFLLIRAGEPGVVGPRYRIHDEQVVIR